MLLYVGSIESMSTAPMMPEWLEPMAATLTQERFTGPEWMFERKFDGIRLLAFKRGSDVRLFSRNRLPQTSPGGRRRRSRSCRCDEVILDGEVTWDGGSGYHVFDILWLDGRDVTRAAARRAPRAAEHAAAHGAAAARRRCSTTTSRGSARAARAGKA